VCRLTASVVAHVLTKRAAGTGKAGGYRSHRNTDDVCHFLVPHALDAHEQEHFAEFLVERVERRGKIAQFQPGHLVRRVDETFGGIIDRDMFGGAVTLAEMADMPVVHDGEKPCPEVGAGLEAVRVVQRDGTAVLDEVVRAFPVPGEGQRISIKAP